VLEEDPSNVQVSTFQRPIYRCPVIDVLYFHVCALVEKDTSNFDMPAF
jgi:hypothetical protein